MKKIRRIVALAAVFTVLGCSKNGFGNSSTNGSSNAASSSPTPTPIPTPTPTPTPGDQYAQYESFVPMAWEARSASTRAWSLYLFSVIDTQTTNLLNGTSDIGTFCSKYSTLPRTQRIQFWAYLFSQITKYESDFDPLNRYVETTLGKDPLTGKQVVSEGLLQLSYQDVLGYPTCRMSWAADKNLAPTDPRKTILDPNINLQCGAIIMSAQVAKRNKIVLSSGQGVYWETLESGARYNQIAAISSATQALPFCH